MNRTHKWRYKRLELQTEKEKLMNSLLSVSEDLMKLHSEVLANRCFDEMMGDPIKCIESWFINETD